MITVDPYQAVDFECNGTVFKIRGMTARESWKIMPKMELKGDNFELSPELTEELLSICFLGWNSDVPFAKEMNLNIDRLSLEEMTSIAAKILELSAVNLSDKKKSLSESPSSQQEESSTVAEKDTASDT